MRSAFQTCQLNILSQAAQVGLLGVGVLADLCFWKWAQHWNICLVSNWDDHCSRSSYNLLENLLEIPEVGQRNNFAEMCAPRHSISKSRVAMFIFKTKNTSSFPSLTLLHTSKFLALFKMNIWKESSHSVGMQKLPVNKAIDSIAWQNQKVPTMSLELNRQSFIFPKHS